MESSTPLLALRDCTVMRDGRAILHIDDLTLRTGEHVCVLGPNGAGKSTLIRLLTRDVRPVAHEDGSPAVLLLGAERWDIMAARRLMGIVSDALQESYTVGVTVRDAVTSGFFGSIGLYRHQTVTAGMDDRADELLDFLEIGHLAGRRMDTLSTGEARRALIARALVHDPAFLVLDEPCDGLDPHATWHFLATLDRVAAAGHTLVLVTHHVEDIAPDVQRVIMIKQGRLFRDGAKRELMTSANLGELFDIPVEVEERAGRYRLW